MSATRVDPETVAALADLLGARDVIATPGAPLPVLWHWAALAQWSPWHLLGPDGHADDASLPTRADLPRRMFAGGEVQVRRPLRVGEEVRSEQEVAAVRDTEGRSGPLRFVTVRHRLTGRDGGLLHERQDLVYRAAARPATGESAAPPRTPGTEGPAGLDPERWAFRADTTLLARFSALTRNSHRIHHDRAWATEVEGYADLVVHGPLLAIVLAERARRSGTRLHRVLHRGRSPLLVGREATVEHRATPDATTYVLRAGSQDLSELTVPHPEESP